MHRRFTILNYLPKDYFLILLSGEGSCDGVRACTLLRGSCVLAHFQDLLLEGYVEMAQGTDNYWV